HLTPPTPKVVILSRSDDEGHLTSALQADVHAFLLKDASDETLIDTIRRVHWGQRLLSLSLLERMMREFAELRRQQTQAETGLAPEERTILALLAGGASNSDIAASSHWSLTSVKRRLRDIYHKIDVSNRAEAAAEAVRRGLV
ncbi:MAG: response regulator transcription factor, partial [Chloroflexota bacterium]|nr:response regulator transcription factor [Chloroflexota bacterium]